jgi:hypothetical protein
MDEEEPDIEVTYCDYGEYWDRPIFIEGAKCVEPTENCALGYETYNKSSKAISDCFYCSGGKVLSADPSDPLAKCVDWIDFNSCELGYRISNRGFE